MPKDKPEGPISEIESVIRFSSSLGATGGTGPAAPMAELRVQHHGQMEWSEHALHYEIDMMNQLRDLWQHRQSLAHSLDEPQVKALNNALIESLVVHIRCLVEFFREKRESKDPAESKKLVHLEDFLGTQQTRAWRSKNLSKIEGDRLEELWNIISIHAMHPMRKRTDNAQDRIFDFEHEVDFFNSIVKKFIKTPGVINKLSQNCDWSRWTK